MKRIYVFLFLVMFLMSNTLSCYAIVDPLKVSNNFFGIHILFTDELADAAKLVNSNGGDWGYVTIPIQATDRDLDKWQSFMDNAAKLHVIPILRLATQLDYIKKSSWKKPDDYDLVDFANFLNSLHWPTKNRYIILFNEINRFDEWGGDYPDPSYYAELLRTAHDIFKQRNEDFFLIMGGFDNASVTDHTKYMNEFEFLNQMVAFDSTVFDSIDGISSHSYPNPAFSDSPNSFKRVGISTYKFEYNFVNSFANTVKPVFITETGWDSKHLGDETVRRYFYNSFTSFWEEDKDKIVAITPFLLRSESGQFDSFSFYKNGQPTSYYALIQSLSKNKGTPFIEPIINNETIAQINPSKKQFTNSVQKNGTKEFSELLKYYAKWFLGLSG